MKYYAVLVGLLFAWAPFAVGDDGSDFLASHGVGLEFDVSTGANKSLIGVDFRLGQLQSLDVERLRLPTSIVSMNLDALNLSTLEPVARLANLQSIVVGDGGNALSEVSLVPLTQLPNLRDVTLRRAPILRRHIVELSYLPALRTLRIDHSCLKSDAAAPISSLSSINCLILENFSGGAEQIKSLTMLKGVQRLALTNWSCKDATAVEALAGMEKSQVSLELLTPTPSIVDSCSAVPNLTSLVIIDAELSEQQIKAIAEISGLRSLALISCRYDVSWLRNLSSLEKLSEVYLQGGERFDHGGYAISRNDFDFLLELSQMDLVVLDFDGTAVQMRSYFRTPRDKFVADIGLRRPRTLWISDAPDVALGWLVERPSFVRSLSSITARNCDLRDDTLSTIAKEALNAFCIDIGGNTEIRNFGVSQIAKLPLLRELSVSAAAYVSDAAFADVPMDKFESLDLSGTSVGDATLLRFAGSGKLRFADLGGTNVTDDGCAGFASATHLRTLRLSDTRVTAHGLAALRDCNELVVLALSGTRVSDMGLANVYNITSLRSIDLSWTAVSDVGVAGLTALPSLNELMLYGTNIGSDTRDLLNSALPRVVIYGTE